MSYDSHNPLLLLGTITAFILFYFARVLILYMILWPLKKYRICTSLRINGVNGANSFDVLKRKLFWGEFLWIFLEGYIEILLAAVLTWYAPPTSFENTLWAKMSSVWMFFIALVIMPFCIIYVLTRRLFKLKQRDFKLKWGVLYNGIDTKNRAQLFYYFLFLIRRIAYVLIISEGWKQTPIY